MNNLISQVDQITDDFKNSFGTLTKQQLNWKPNPHAWSIHQNIEHLIIVNESYYPIIESIRKANYQPPLISKMNFIVSLLGEVILKSVSPDRRKKIKTFPIWEPQTSEINSDILKKFESHQKDLKTLIIDSDDLISKKAVITSPANKNIVYKIETAFEIIVTHEQRHFNQAKDVQNKLIISFQ